MTQVEIHEAHATRDGNVLTLSLAEAADGSDTYPLLSLDETPPGGTSSSA